MQPLGEEAKSNEKDLNQSFLDLYRNALISGDAAIATSVVNDALASGLTPGRIYLSILIPAQIEIGKLWSDCKVGVCEEHRATQITISEMTRLRFLIKPLSNLGVKAALASVDGDDHYLGARVIADFLYMDGWEVHFLGSKTPIDDLISFVSTNKFDLVGLAATGDNSLNSLQETIKKLKLIPSAPKIILGGDAVYKNLDLVQSFNPDGIAFNAEEAVVLARKLCDISPQDAALAHYLKSLGQRIVEARKHQKFSQQRLAENAGLDRAYISSVENGKQNVTIGAIVKLASALNLSLNDLLVGK